MIKTIPFKALHLIIYIAVLLTSCSKKDHTLCIPSTSSALIAVDADIMADKGSPFNGVTKLFCGKEGTIDSEKKTYFFETVDGLMGVCAPIADGDAIEEAMGNGTMSSTTEIDGIQFGVYSNSWIVGYQNGTLLALGPVTGSSEAKKTMRRMAKMMNQEEEQSIINSQLWEHMKEKESPVRMVAKAVALPEQMMAAVTVGAPMGTDPADVLLEAELVSQNNVMTMQGATCSYNPNIKQSLEKAATVYQPITFDWEAAMKQNTLIGVFMNIKGQDYMPYLRNNKSLNTMLMSSNAYDKIRDNEGNMAILLSPGNGSSKAKEPNMDEVMQNAKQGKDDAKSDFNAEVLNNIEPANAKGAEKLVVIVNLESLKGTAAEVLMTLLGNTQKIIYKLR